MKLPVESPLRRPLADELHARPFESVTAPGVALSVAMLRRDASRDADCLALMARLDPRAVDPARPAAHARAQWRGLSVRYERHTEFYSFVVLAEAPGLGLASAFDTAWLEALPAGWLAELPGEMIASAQVALLPTPDEPPHAREVGAVFGGELLVGNRIADGRGTLVTDLRPVDGRTRYLVFDHGLDRRRAGRVVQRLIEIDTYRMMALLSLPIAARRMGELGAEEAQLAGLMARVRSAQGNDESLLDELGGLATRVEHALADHGARFAATRAYASLVARRLLELRERSAPGLQPLSAFLDRRFRPAVDSCAAAEARQAQLSERVARAAQLLQARFELERERQNQALLASLDRRQGLQLRLQETVEGLSVIAMTYYGTALFVDLLRPFADAWGVAEHWVAVVGVPLVGCAVVLNMRRLRRHLAQG